MQVVAQIKTLKRLIGQARRQSKKIGLVPTMGYLHKGHLSLIRLARKHADYVVVSIFVNPTQFSPKEDLTRYPRDKERDLLLLRKEHTDLVFFPSIKEIYPADFRTYVEIQNLSRIFCGLSRPTHFRGVATIVLKLFNIVEPDIAVFGQKDYQQALIIKKMVRDLNMDIQVITGKIIREPDGFAMSSRNTYLNTDERRNAAVIYRSLKWIKKHYRDFNTSTQALSRACDIIKKAGGRIDYIKAVDKKSLMPIRSIKKGTCILVAVFFGKTRLIDNIII